MSMIDEAHGHVLWITWVSATHTLMNRYRYCGYRYRYIGDFQP